MNRNTLLILLALTALTLPGAQLVGQQQPPVRAKIRVSKEVTFFTEPLDDNGFIDYATALNRVLGKGVTAENNANVLIWKALGPHPEGATMPKEFFQWMGIEPPPEQGDYFTSLWEFTRERMDAQPTTELMDAIYEEQARAMKTPWKRSQSPQIAGWLDANKFPLELTVKASQRAGYFSPLVVKTEDGAPGGLIAVLLPAVQMTRSLSRALSARAMLRLGEGEIEAAWDDIVALHRLGRHLGQGATLVESLVGIAIDGVAVQAHIAFLQHAELTPARWNRCRQEFDALPDLPSAASQVQLGERCMYLDSVNIIARRGLAEINGLNAMVGEEVSPAAGVFAKLAGGAIDFSTTMEIGNQWYDRMVEALRIEDRAQRLVAVAEIEQDIEKSTQQLKNPIFVLGMLAGGGPGKGAGQAVGRVLVAMLLPAVSATSEAEFRARQWESNLKVAQALAAYRSDQGAYPKRLNALAPKYLAEVPKDVFSGQQLIYLHKPKGYLLYSVGRNGVNDEGRRQDDGQGDDLTVRIAK